MSRRIHHFLTLSILSLLTMATAQDINISGTVVDESSNPVQNALVRLQNLGYVTLTDQDGKFVLNNTSPIIIQKKNTQKHFYSFSNGILKFNIQSPSHVHFEIYSLQGRLSSIKNAGVYENGTYECNLHSLLPGKLSSSPYIIKAIIGNKTLSFKMINYKKGTSHFYIKKSNLSRFAKMTDVEPLDYLIIEKLGFTTKTFPLSSYGIDLGPIPTIKSIDINEPRMMTILEDSLFNELKNNIRALDSLNGPDDLKAINFISLRNGFETIIEIDSTRMKSSVGFIVSSILSLNSNSQIWKVVDSIDAYIRAIDSSDSESDTTITMQSMKDGGMLALGKALAVSTPQLLMTTTQKPSLPAFLTLGHIQNLISNEIAPILDNVIKVSGRIESLENASLLIDTEEDTFELDKGEIYVFDAYVHLLRAYLNFLCIYNVDLYASPEKQNYSWIDDIVRKKDSDDRFYKILSNDTLYNIQFYGKETDKPIILAKTFQYNLENRPDFLTIRKDLHQSVYNDLKAIPSKIKSAKAAIQSETDEQSNDLIKISMIDSASSELIDFSAKLRDKGFSESFANNFSSIDSITDFISEILSGPFTFNESVDSVNVNITIDLSAFFTNPVTDLRQLFPKYTWTNEAEWVKANVYKKTDESFYTREFVFDDSSIIDTLYFIPKYSYEDDSIIVDPDVLDSVKYFDFGTYRYYVSTPIRYHCSLDSNFYLDPLRLLDDQGNVMTPEQMDTLIQNKQFFPYFNDYTFHGIFPGMTRNKWIDLIYKD